MAYFNHGPHRLRCLALVVLHATGLYNPQSPHAVFAEGGSIRSGNRNIITAHSAGHESEYILWSKDDTYFETCRQHYIGNHTWGKPLTKLVDKAHVKSIVEAMNIDGLKVPQTLAIYDSRNISELTVNEMRRIPQPYIIKPTHSSGSVSRVKDDKYTCLKSCKSETKNATLPIGKEALDIILKTSEKSLEDNHYYHRNEPQYKDIPHQIIIEEDVQVADIQADVSYWYTSNGQPLFVSVQCAPTGENELGTSTERAFFNTNFEILDMRLSKDPCPNGSTRPSNWEKQVEVATMLAKHVPGILRIDLYSGESQIYFSEFTFTTAFCGDAIGFRPRVADGLLHAVQYGAIDPARATPELVKNTIHDASWVFLTLLDGRTVHPSSSQAFPSPVDLCEFVNADKHYADSDWQDNKKVKGCIAVAKRAADLPLRCIVGSDKTSILMAASDQKTATFSAVMAHVDWGRAITLLLAILLMTHMNIGTTRQKNQYVNNIFYLVVMAIVMYLTVPSVKSVFSSHSVIDITKQSFAAFAYVHPMESPHIALFHFALYWFHIAAWRSKSLRNLLFWQFLVETVSSSMNEYSHLIEEQDVIHCTRVAFKDSMKQCVFDNMLREYVLPPFFVYGYLLPKFIIHWSAWFSIPRFVLLIMTFIVMRYMKMAQKTNVGLKAN